MDQFYQLCLQGDIQSAMAHLRTLQPRTDEIEQLEEKYNRRFYTEGYQEEVQVDDPWIKQVVSAYYQYFRTVLVAREQKEIAEAGLKEQLGLLLPGGEKANLDETEEELQRIFEEKGYSFQGGVTPPFRGPYIWRKVETESLIIELPLGKQPVTVHKLLDFILESWMPFATFDRHGVGGWAMEEALYCNWRRYCKPGSSEEEYQVSYLKHEAQHMYDYKHYPGLKSHELEYRAKLVELIYTKDHTLLNKFAMQARNLLEFPHPFGAYNVVKDLSSRLLGKEFESDPSVWRELEYSQIASAAHELLVEDSRKLDLVKNG